MRLAMTLLFVGLLFGAFALSGIAERRWRDVVEGGVPAVALIGLGLLAGRRALRG